MKDKKSTHYKVSFGSYTNVWEIFVHMALVIGVIYAVYTFFHQKDAENNLADQKKIQK